MFFAFFFFFMMILLLCSHLPSCSYSPCLRYAGLSHQSVCSQL